MAGGSRGGRRGGERSGGHEAPRREPRRAADRRAADRRAAGPAEIDPRIARRKDEVAQASGRRRLWIATAFLAGPGCIATAFVMLHSALFAVARVQVSGAIHTSRAAILARAGLLSHPPLIDVNPVAVEARIESLPWIGRATVVRHWPKSVSIVLTERVPVAEASLGRSWELFDPTGRALAVEANRAPGLVRVARTGTMPAPGAWATGALHSEILLVDALPTSIAGEVRLVEARSGTGLVARLSGATSAIFGGSDGLGEKARSLATLLARHVPLARSATIDLRVASSPVVGRGG